MLPAKHHLLNQRQDNSPAGCSPQNGRSRLGALSLLSFLCVWLLPQTTLAQIGKIAEFTRGNSNFIEVPSAPYFGKNFTFEAWVHPKNYVDDQPVFDFENPLLAGTPAANLTVRMRLNISTAGTLQLYTEGLGITGTTYSSSAAAVPVQKWSHIAITADGNNLTMYVNGISVGTSSVFNWNPSTTYAGTFRIGTSNVSGTDFANMYMDEFRVWNKWRSATEIQGTMNTTLTGNEQNLTLCYDFENAVNGNGTNVPNKVASLPVPNMSGVMVMSGTAPLTFNFTGAVQTWTVPAGVTSITVDARGAKGGNSNVSGGSGGRVQTTLAVTPGQVLNIYVGGAGQNRTTTTNNALGGWNGGGFGGYDLVTGSGGGNAGGGGGATDIRIGGTALSDRVLVAAGGGGAALSYPGGSGGGTSGSAGSQSHANTAGGGATATTGGTANTARGATAGISGQGGNGATNLNANGGGGGGGGFFGGGGGTSVFNHSSGQAGGGGGGSSWVNATLTSGTTHTAGNNAGDGSLTITFSAPNTTVFTGKYGNGVDLLSNNTYSRINIGYGSVGQEIGENYTMEAWVFPRSHQNNAELYNAVTSDGNNRIRILASDGTSGRIRLEFFNGTTSIGNFLAPAPSALALNQWTHVAVVVYANQAWLYLNGTQVGAYALSQIVPLLRRHATIGGNADMRLDEFRIWSVARTQAQVQASMNGPLTGSENSLYLNYDMEGVVGNHFVTVRNNTVHPVFGTRAGRTSGSMIFFDPNAGFSTLPNNGTGFSNARYIASPSTLYTRMSSGTAPNGGSNQHGSTFGFSSLNPPSMIIGGYVNSPSSYCCYYSSTQSTGWSNSQTVMVEGWIKPKSTGGGTIVGMVDPTNGPNTSSDFPFDIEYGSDGRIYAYRKTKGSLGSINSGGATINDGKWHHVAVRYDNTYYAQRNGSFLNRTSVSGFTSYVWADAGAEYFTWSTTAYIYIDGVLAASGPVGSTTTHTASGTSISGTCATCNFGTAYYLSTTPSSNYVNCPWGLSFGVNMQGSLMDEWRITSNTTPDPNTPNSSKANKQWQMNNDGDDLFTSTFGSNLANVTMPWGAAANVASVENTSITPRTATYTFRSIPGVNAYEFKVVAAGAGVNGTAVATGTSTAPTFTATNLTPGRAYDIFVKGSFFDVKGAWSDPIRFTTQAEWRTALHFDGVGDHIIGPTYSTSQPSSYANSTVEFWYRPESGVSTNQNIFNRTASGTNGIQIYRAASGGTLRFLVYGSNGSAYECAAPVQDNQWQHIACVVSNEHLYIYRNGKLEGAARMPSGVVINYGANPIRIGVNSSNTNFFKGSLDEIRYWSTARTPNQIQEFMYTQPTATETGLMLYYRFDEASGTVATNTCTNITSPTGDGTLTNFALTGTTSNRIQRSPLVSTPTFANPTSNSATVGGTFVESGTAPVTELGNVLHPTNANTTFVTTNAISSASTATSGTYTSVATGLGNGTNYQNRPYALSNDGIGLGTAGTGATICSNPDAPTISVTSPATATLNWTSGGYSAYSWRVVRKGFGLNATGANLVSTGAATSPTTSANISGLTAVEFYDVYFRATCVSPNLSAWVGPITFFVPCGEATMPVNETLTAAPNTMPTCWFSTDDNNDGVFWTTNSSNQLQIVANPTQNMDDWAFFASGLNLQAGISYRFRFDYGAMNAATQELLTVKLGTIPDGAAMATAHTLYNGAISNTSMASYGTTFTPTVSGFYYIGFNGRSTANSTGIRIDNVRIDQNPCGSAAVAASVSIGNITGVSAFASWDSVPGVTGYEWKVVLAGSGPTAPSVAAGFAPQGNPSTAILGLNASLQYDFYLRTDCSLGIGSDWTPPITFRTLSVPTISATDNLNDAYIDLNWSVPVSPCMLDGSFQPFTQGVHVELKEGNSILTQESFNDLSDYLGPQQPSMTQVWVGAAAPVSVNGTSISKWQTGIFNWTLESWVQTNAGLSNATLLQAEDNGNTKMRVFFSTPNTLSLSSGTTTVNFSHIFVVERWTHIAVRYKATESKAVLFVDGVERESKTISGMIPSGNYTSLENFTNGFMGELRFWDRGRTNTEITNNRFINSFNTAAQNNLLLHWRWSSLNSVPDDLATYYDNTNNAGTMVGTPVTISYLPTPQYSPIVGSFRHKVGPSQNRTYTLNLYAIGSGAPINTCSNLVDVGTTLPYQQIQAMSASDNQLDRVALTWTNKSKLADNFRIYRDSILIDIIAGTEQIDSVFTYEDVFAENDTLSLDNGAVANYCVETYSAFFSTGYAPQACDNGGTFNIGIAATDNVYPDKVVLTWNNVASYGYSIQIKRDGNLLATLPKTATTYTDKNPIFGKEHTYGVVLVDNLLLTVVGDYDTGGVGAKGAISGRVLTEQGGYGVPGVVVRITNETDATLNDSVTTDFTGAYSFNNLYYGELSNFKLYARKSGHTFVESPITVGLNNLVFDVKNVHFISKTPFTVSNTPLPIDNFTATAAPTADKVNLSWTYTASDTVVFTLYRESTVLGVLHTAGGGVTSFEDLTGTPNVTYNYRIMGYTANGNVLTVGEADDSEQFPAVAVPINLTHSVNSSLGIISLSWAHTSTNFDGFRVYRNNVRIADLAPGVMAYTDYDATPGQSVIYKVTAKRFLDGVTFESNGITTSNLTYPALAQVSTFTATANNLRHSVVLSWTIPTTLQNPNYNFDGYRLYRRLGSANPVFIGQIYKNFSAPLTFEDRDMANSTAYTYSVRPFVDLGGTIFEATPRTANATSTIIRSATGLTASTNVVGEVVLSWTPAINTAGVTNLDGQLLMRGTDTVAFLPANVSTYKAFSNNTPTTAYTVRTYKQVGSTRYYSGALSANGRPATATTTPVFATNAKATQNLPNHVRLSWEYPAYVYSQFIIWKDNAILDTLLTEDRTYYDYNATPGVLHTYAVQPINGSNVGQRALAFGRLKSLLQVTGMVSSANGKYGMPNVDIVASGTNFYFRTRTDSSGFYKIDALPQVQGYALTVTAAGANCTFSPASQLINLGTDREYVVNFQNTYTPPATDSLTPAKPVNMMAKGDMALRRMAIAWKPANDSYDGFEVYRANTLLATIAKGNEMVAFDDDAHPGIFYGYNVRSFIETEDGRIYSPFKGITVDFPDLEPVLDLTANIKASQNKVNLTWSHNWDNHTSYLIKRNGTLLHTVPVDHPLTFDDATGAPGKLYTYSVEAVYTIKGKTYTSTPVSIDVTYPGVLEISDLQANVPTEPHISPSAPCVMTGRNLNHVRLTWDYTLGANDGFAVYRDGVYIGATQADSMRFEDYKGIPGTAHNYTVRAILDREGTKVQSQGKTANAVFPNLSIPRNFTVLDSGGLVWLDWQYPENVVDGFYLYRGLGSNPVAIYDTLVAKFEDGNFQYPDRGGLPGLVYTYHIQAYAKRNNVMYLSEIFSCVDPHTFPLPATPAMVTASDGTHNSYVKISWNYAAINNLNGFEIYRDSIKIGETTKGMREYNDISVAATGNYMVRAYLEANGTRYYSAYSDADMGSVGTPINILTLADSTVGGTLKRFGHALDLETDGGKDWIVVGAPGVGFADSSYVKLYTYNAATKSWDLGNIYRGFEQKTGASVSISDKEATTASNTLGRIFLGAPGGNQWHDLRYNTTNGSFNTATNGFIGGGFNPVGLGEEVFCKPNFQGVAAKASNTAYRRSGTPAQWTGPANVNFGSSFDGFSETSNDLFIGAPDLNKVYRVQTTDGNLTLLASSTPGTTNDPLILPPNLSSAAKFGQAVSARKITGFNNMVLVGAPGQGGTAPVQGAAYIYENGYAAANRFMLPTPADLSPGDGFGSSVAVYGNFALVGAPGHQGGRGAAYLYARQAANNWVFVRKFAYTASKDSVGAKVQLNATHLAIAAPNTGNGEGAVYTELLSGVIADVRASDGLYANKTRVSWRYYSNTNNIDGFSLYRDGVFIGVAAKTDTVYEDGDGEPGRRYVYEIAAYTTANGEIRRYADEGYRKPNGVIQGQVQTLMGGAVPNVKITAMTEISGNYYIYQTYSNATGYFHFPNVYYEPTGSIYALYPEYKDHVFLENPVYTNLSTALLNNTSVAIYDMTAYVVTGVVKREGAACGIDSVGLKVVYKFVNNSTSQTPTIYSDANGEYSIPVDPYQNGLVSMQVQIDSTKTTYVTNQKKEIRYRFVADANTNITDIANLPTNMVVNFNDTTRYPVKLSVVTACNTAVTGGKFQIRVSAKDGCYDQLFTTNLNGDVTVSLPPFNYDMVVEGVENLNVQTDLVVNYLRYRPMSLPLADLDRDTANQLSPVSFALLSQRSFPYHKPAQISIVSGVNFACGDPSKPIVVYQRNNGNSGRNKFVFAVNENHNNADCHVKIGHIRVENAAAVEDQFRDTVYMVGNSFAAYEFESGNPNLVFPFLKTLRASYYSDGDELLASQTFAVLVVGSTALPGTDVIVNPASDNGTNKLPLFVLRDPPGDNSSSTLSKGSSVTKSISVQKTLGGGGLIEFGTEIGFFGADIEIEISANNSGEDVWNRNWEISATTNKEISTSGEPSAVGEKADVLVGAGLLETYGIVQTLSLGKTALGCDTVYLTNEISLKKLNLQTEWLYTIQMIEDQINLFGVQINQVRNGSLVLKIDNQRLTKSEALKYLEDKIISWTYMLYFHKVETLPYYNLCTQTSSRSQRVKTDVTTANIRAAIGSALLGESVPAGRTLAGHIMYELLENGKLKYESVSGSNRNWDKLTDTHKKVAEDWRKGFCGKIDKNPSDQIFEPDFKRVFDADIMKAYNNITSVLGTIKSGQLSVGDLGSYAYSEQNMLNNNYVNAQQVALYGAQAKNVTYGGMTSYNESFESATSSSYNYTNSYNLELSFKIGKDFAADLDQVVAPLGVGVIKKELVKFEGTFYVTGTFNYGFEVSRENAIEESNSISYSLSDDDIGDQFSVNIIQGIDPSHTPYFQLVGGRSSCPQELGTIYRDRLNIALYDEPTQSTAFEQTMDYVPAEGAAVFQVQLANLSVFNEERDVRVSLDPASNPDGAIVKMAGLQLGALPLTFTLSPNEPLIMPLTVERGLYAFDYEDITLSIEPDCDDSDIIDETLNTEISVNVHFVSPCSEVNILTPDSEWRINRRNLFDANSREILPIRMVDYDPYNEKLDHIRLEYRRIGTNQWATIPNSEVSREDLADHNEANFLPNQVPYYLFIWDMTDDLETYPDGTYEIRAVAECQADGRNYSAYIRGKIDRSSTLFGNPEPADHIWTVGDEISVSYNRDLAGPLVTADNFQVINLSNPGSVLPGTVAAHNNKVMFTPAVSPTIFDGDTLRMVVGGLKSFDGNDMDSVYWDFVVVGKQLYMKDNHIMLSLVQGDSARASVLLINNREDAVPINYQVQGLAAQSAWLTAENDKGALLFNQPQLVDFHIQTRNLPIGTKQIVLPINAGNASVYDSIHVTVKVLASPPKWTVNPNDYDQSMLVISNFRFNNSGPASTDSMDLISVWIDGQVRGVGRLERISGNNYAAIVQTYGKAADANKPLKFAVWDASAASEYDARTFNNSTVTYASNKVVGGVLSPLMLNVTAADRVRYIPLNEGWTMFSVNADGWNAPVNTAMASLKNPTAGDVIKTAHSSATYVAGTGWVTAGVYPNRLDSTNTHRGYQVYLDKADTLRISGTNPVIAPILLQQGWNLVGYPLQRDTTLAAAFQFYDQPDSVTVKTVAQNPTYSKNMAAFYQGGNWIIPNGSDMQSTRPNFAYWMRVKNNAPGSAPELLYPGYNGNLQQVALRSTSPKKFDLFDHSSWTVNPADYEHNMLLTATVNYNREEIEEEGVKVGAYIGDECRGVGKMVYVPELQRYLVSMFVYANGEGENIKYRVYHPKKDQYFDHFEPISFVSDDMQGTFVAPLRLTNVVPDNSFTGSVHPNPFVYQLKVNLKSDRAQSYKLRLTDVTGQTVMEEVIEDAATEVDKTLRTDHLNLPDGVYFLQAIGSLGETRSFKVVQARNK